MQERAKTIRKKEQILAAALDCYTEQGYANSSVEQIRNASGASVGSIYHHFGNKEGIFAALFIEGMRDYHGRLREALESSNKAEHSVKSMVRCFADWVVSNPDWARFVFYERQTIMSTPHKTQVIEDNRKHFGFIKDVLRKHAEAGTIRKMSPDLYSAFIIGPTQYVAKNWLTGRSKDSLAEHIQSLEEAAWLCVKCDNL